MPTVQVLLVLLCAQCLYAVSVNLTSSTPVNVQKEAVLALIRRILPNEYHDFFVSIDPDLGPALKTTFRLTSERGKVRIIGNSGVAAAWGFHYYLKHWCHCHISWEGRQLNIPRPLPTLPRDGVQVTSHDQFRYYSNVCTFSYSFVWWDWTQWENHIDWMAMNAINLPLAFTGQEAIWRNVYLNLGLTQSELDQHFPGPAFLAWGRMGNIRGWGGPLPPHWYDRQLQLQKRIVQRMREFGMITVLPGFAGHVPDALLRVKPDANVTRLGLWSRFSETFSGTLLLEARQPLFRTIGNMFVAEMIRQFGTDHVYNADPFNEMTPSTGDPQYLREFGQGVLKGMTDSDPKAVWLLQGWMFLSKAYWHPEQAEALLTSVPIGKMLILDLYSEQRPQFQDLNSYYGQPFIWCMLLNFGGVLGYYGQIDSVNTGPTRARTMENSSMVGIGLTMEGIFQNYAIFDFLLEKTYTDSVDISSWMATYSRRRYGLRIRKMEKFWQNAAKSVFNCTLKVKDHGQYILFKRPAVHSKPFIWYPPRTILFMWRKVLQASDVASGDLFRYDLVDISRQALTVASIKIYRDLLFAYRHKNLTQLQQSGTEMLTLLNDMDEILATDENYLLGPWIEDARKNGVTTDEKNLLDFNARIQLTTWGPEAEINDYARKQWSGLVSDYYQPRWRLLISHLVSAVQTGQKFNYEVFKREILETIEKPFSHKLKSYPTTPTGDSLAISRRLFDVYRKYLSGHKIPDFSKKSKKVKFVQRPSINVWRPLMENDVVIAKL